MRWCYEDYCTYLQPTLLKNAKGEYGLVERKIPGDFRKRSRHPEPEFRRKIEKFNEFDQWVEKTFGIKIKDDQGYLYIFDTNTIYITDPEVDMQGRDIKEFIKNHKK